MKKCLIILSILSFILTSCAVDAANQTQEQTDPYTEPTTTDGTQTDDTSSGDNNGTNTDNSNSNSQVLYDFEVNDLENINAFAKFVENLSINYNVRNIEYQAFQDSNTPSNCTQYLMHFDVDVVIKTNEPNEKFLSILNNSIFWVGYPTYSENDENDLVLREYAVRFSKNLATDFKVEKYDETTYTFKYKVDGKIKSPNNDACEFTKITIPKGKKLSTLKKEFKNYFTTSIYIILKIKTDYYVRNDPYFPVVNQQYSFK